MAHRGLSRVLPPHLAEPQSLPCALTARRPCRILNTHSDLAFSHSLHHQIHSWYTGRSLVCFLFMEEMCLERLSTLAGTALCNSFQMPHNIPQYFGEIINLTCLQLLLIKCLLHTGLLTEPLTCIVSLNPQERF